MLLVQMNIGNNYTTLCPCIMSFLISVVIYVKCSITATLKFLLLKVNMHLRLGDADTPGVLHFTSLSVTWRGAVKVARATSIHHVDNRATVVCPIANVT
jgi:hypothetical protein